MIDTKATFQINTKTRILTKYFSKTTMICFKRKNDSTFHCADQMIDSRLNIMLKKSTFHQLCHKKKKKCIFFVLFKIQMSTLSIYFRVECKTNKQTNSQTHSKLWERLKEKPFTTLNATRCIMIIALIVFMAIVPHIRQVIDSTKSTKIYTK